MMCLEDTWFVAAVHSTPMHDPGLRPSWRALSRYENIGERKRGTPSLVCAGVSEGGYTREWVKNARSGLRVLCGFQAGMCNSQRSLLRFKKNSAL